MAESIKGLHRSHRCTEVTENDIGKTVTLMGWASKRRNLGSLIFVDLRDRSGLMQILFDEKFVGSEGFKKAESIRNEFVIAVVGDVQKRSAAVNEHMATGSIEVVAKEIRILSESKTPPFLIEDDINTKDELRLKYRYLDLRRPIMQKNIIMKSKVMQSIRNFLSENGFLEIETPILQKSTPEGARDYLVPSRIHKGRFYALPQSPQLFKQILMCSGFDRYFQLARCFRDEDLRKDRQPEFTQVDMELSFVDMDDVIDVNERLLKKVFHDAIGLDIKIPFKRMTYKEAMERFGSDKPDTRFEMEINNISDLVKDCDFSVFKDAIQKGGSVRCIKVEGGGDFSRKKLDKLIEIAKGSGAKGLSYIQLKEDGTHKCSFSKFVKEELLCKIEESILAKKGDLILIAADKNKIVFNVLGQLRLILGEELNLIDKNKFNFLWIIDFPLFEWSDEEERFVAMHHPFTMPYEEDIKYMESDPGKVRAKAYDIVLNGVELGGGSIRIHQDDIQELMFKALGFSKEDAWSRFGFLLNAFQYGVPPHAGLAYGLDRMLMLMLGCESIRDVIAFPKVKDATCLMTDAPDKVDEKQLLELGIDINSEDESEEN